MVRPRLPGRAFLSRVAPVLILAVVLAACGGGDETAGPPAEAPVISGKELFAERILVDNAGCITCHSLDPDTRLVGPSIAGVATRAAARQPGVSAEEYLRKSIVAPSAYVVEGFEDGRMPADWDEMLTPAEIDALVAYLLTLD